MPKQTDFNPDRVQLFTDMALALAADAKGADLDDGEIEGVLDWCSWWVLALAHGMDPVHWAAAVRADEQDHAD